MSLVRLVHINLGQILSLLLVFGLVSTTVIAADALHVIEPNGSTDLSFKDSSGNLVRMTVTQMKLESSYPYKDALLWGGDIGALPQTVLRSIRIQKGNETIFVPLSAYGDLGDVKAVSFELTTRGFRLNLHGGNTASSYDAALVFEQGYLRSRTVRLRELPEQRWEKTTYAFPRRSGE